MRLHKRVFLILLAMLFLVLPGCSSSDDDPAVVIIDGTEVPWSEYFYWLSYCVYSIVETNGSISSWDSYVGDVPLVEYILNDATQSVRFQRAVEKLAGSLDVTLSDEDRATLQSIWDSEVLEYGGGSEEAFLEYLAASELNKDLYYYINEVSLLFSKCITTLYGENGANISDEYILEYANANSYRRVKHILISNTDTSGNVYPLTELNARLGLAEQVLGYLDQADDPIAMFDDLVGQYGEDEGMLLYPGGYCYPAGSMYPEFEAAVEALGDNEYSRVVESSLGWHIILRLPVLPDSVVDSNGMTLRGLVATTDAVNEVDTVAAEMNVDYTDYYDTLDIPSLFS